ncbi:MAG TPA: TolC family protein, partial [Gammaproteobacteria bacterium]|nr:TolC family protein [Gammaproteobacteria bacterium]
RYPEFVELAAREQEADALLRRGDSWLSNQPAIAMRYQTDRPWDNANYREYEIGVELPLWRIGERRTAGALGAAAAESAVTAATALRHEVIGLLRTTLWDIEHAYNELALARSGVQVAEALMATIERMYQAGELPLSETLLMRSTVMQREAAVIVAEALLVDAERAFQSLTGLSERPANIAEPLTQRSGFDDSHPRALLAASELERARAELDMTRRSSKGTPILTVAPQRDRAAFSNYTANSLNVSVSIPFGGRGHSDTAITAAAREVAAAESELSRVLRGLNVELHEARHGLSVIEASLVLAEQRSELAARSFAMSERAFAQGEISLLELLRSEEIALQTRREVAGLEVERLRSIAQINQATGVWP